MTDVDVQGTSKIAMICTAGPRGHGQRDKKVDIFDIQKYQKPGNLNTCRLVKLSCDLEQILINLQLSKKTLQIHSLHRSKIH